MTDHLRALLAKAELPWEIDASETGIWSPELNEAGDIVCSFPDAPESNKRWPDNAALIVAAVNALGPHLDAMEAKDAENARLREALEVIVEEAGSCRDTGWESYSDGYAAAKLECAKIARTALNEEPKT